MLSISNVNRKLFLLFKNSLSFNGGEIVAGKKSLVIFMVFIVFMVLVISGFLGKKYDDYKFKDNIQNRSDYFGGSAKLITDGIEDIEIDWPVGIINVSQYNGDKIILTERSESEIYKENELQYIVSDGTLKINYSSKKTDESNNVDRVLEKDFDLKIPENIILIQELDINTVSGKLKVSADNIIDLNVNAISGDVLIGGKYRDIDCNGISGNINMNLSEIPKDIEIDTTNGEIELKIPENDGFEAEYNLKSGDFKCEFPVTYIENNVIYKKALSSFEFNSRSGNILISRQ